MTGLSWRAWPIFACRFAEVCVKMISSTSTPCIVANSSLLMMRKVLVCLPKPPLIFDLKRRSALKTSPFCCLCYHAVVAEFNYGNSALPSTVWHLMKTIPLATSGCYWEVRSVISFNYSATEAYSESTC